MTEIIGFCKSFDNETKVLIIEDDEGDDIEVDLNKGDLMFAKLRTFIGQRTSFYYDRQDIRIRVIPIDEIIATTYPNGERRTISSLS